MVISSLMLISLHAAYKITTIRHFSTGYWFILFSSASVVPRDPAAVQLGRTQRQARL